MLRSVNNRRLEPIAWARQRGRAVRPQRCDGAMMRIRRTDSPSVCSTAISLLAWTLAVLGCVIAIDRQHRVLELDPAGERGVGATAAETPSQRFAEATAPGWELTAHILLSMAAAALLFAAAVDRPAVRGARPPAAHAGASPICRACCRRSMRSRR